MRFCVRFCFVLSFVLCVQSAMIGENIYHTVEKGDTLYSLANAVQTAWARQMIYMSDKN